MSEVEEVKYILKDKIGGMDDMIDKIVDLITNSVNPQTTKYQQNHAFLITGGVGCGKTFLVSEIVKALNIPYLFVKSASILQANIGDSERYLHDVFEFADTHDQSILVFDDIEILVPAPTSIVSMFQVRLSSYFMDEVRKRNLLNSRIAIIGIVGQMQLNSMNKALCCCDYMDTIISVPKLDKRRRTLIIEKYLKNCCTSELINKIAEDTASYSAADLCNLCSACHSLPTKENIEKQLIVHSTSSTRQLHMVTPLSGGMSALLGCENLIQQVKENIIHPMLHPELFARYHLQPPTGAVFYGPSGCGKSAMVHAMAAELQNRVQMIEVSCSDVLGKYLGDSEKKLHEVFSLAREASPSILVLDNIETLAQHRGNDNSEEKTFDRLLSCLLTELDGLYANQVFVIGTTTDLHLLDQAVIRPGRLEFHLRFSLPNPNERRILLTEMLKNIQLENEDIITWLVFLTSDKSIADLKGIVTNAIMKSLREGDDPILLKRSYFST